MFLARTKTSFFPILLLGGLLLAEPAGAKPGGAPTATDSQTKKKIKIKDENKDRADAAERLNRMQERRGQALEEAGITGTQAKQVMEATKPLDKERLELQTKLQAKRQTLKKLVEAASKDAAAYTALITDFRKLEHNIASLRDREFDVTEKILKPHELAKLLLVRGWGEQRGRRNDGDGGGAGR